MTSSKPIRDFSSVGKYSSALIASAILAYCVKKLCVSCLNRPRVVHNGKTLQVSRIALVIAYFEKF